MVSESRGGDWPLPEGGGRALLLTYLDRRRPGELKQSISLLSRESGLPVEVLATTETVALAREAGAAGALLAPPSGGRLLALIRAARACSYRVLCLRYTGAGRRAHLRLETLALLLGVARLYLQVGGELSRTTRLRLAWSLSCKALETCLLVVAGVCWAVLLAVAFSIPLPPGWGEQGSHAPGD